MKKVFKLFVFLFVLFISVPYSIYAFEDKDKSDFKEPILSNQNGLNFDFDLRYQGGDYQMYSCKYFEGTPIDDTPLPFGIRIDYNSSNIDYPYTMTVLDVDDEHMVTITCFTGDKISADYIRSDREVGYCIYFAKGLLITGENKDVGLNFNNISNENVDVSFYNIVSTQKDAKLKIDISRFYYSDNGDHFYDRVFQNENERPHHYAISAYDIILDNINGTDLSGGTDSCNIVSLDICIEFYSSLIINNSNINIYSLGYNYSFDAPSPVISSLIKYNGSDSSVSGNSPIFKITNSNVVLDSGLKMDNDNFTQNVVPYTFDALDSNKMCDFIAENSSLQFFNGGLFLGPTTFKDCSKVSFNNSSPMFSNINSYGGGLNFINSNFNMYSVTNNISYQKLDSSLYKDFSVLFDLDEYHRGSMQVDYDIGGPCINTNEGSFKIGDNDNMVANTYEDYTTDVLYDSKNKDRYKLINILHIPELSVIAETPDPNNPSKPIHLPYYYDKKNNKYYEDKFALHEIDDIDDWLTDEWSYVPSLDGNEKYKLSISEVSDSGITLLKDNSISSKKRYYFSCDAGYYYFGFLLVNGKPIVNGASEDTTYYNLHGDEENMYIEFSQKFLESLPEKNTINILNYDGHCSGEFTVYDNKKEPSKPSEKTSGKSYTIPKTGIK